MGTTGGTLLEAAPQEWPRFSSYEVEDGYIRPLADAELSGYKPWTAMDSQVGGPLEHLLQLSAVRRARRERDDGRAVLPYPLHVSAEEEAEIVDWCSRWGPLGVLHHRVERVVLALGADAHRFTFRDEQLVYEKSHKGGWSSRKQRPLRFWEAPAPPSVTVRHLDPYAGFTTQQGAIVEPLTERWWRYFPDLTRTRYRSDVLVKQTLVGSEAREFESSYFPSPASDDFWEIYREPVSDFLEAALVLEKAIRLAAIAADGSAPAERRWLGVRGISGLTRDVQAIPIPSELGGLRLAYVSPSLLGLLAQWALVQTLGGRLGFCAWGGCGMPFIGRPDRGYCSETHRANAHKARQRHHKRQRQAEAQSA